MAGKYSDAEIKKRAQIFVQADKSGDPRAFLVIMQMSIKTGMHPDTIKNKIYTLAGY